MWARWAFGANDVVWSFFREKPLKHHRIMLGQKLSIEWRSGKIVLIYCNS
jgi:hypothetical protein